MSVRQSHLRGSSRRGLTLVEVVISTLLISGLMVAAMDAVGASVVERERLVNQTRGQQLADSLLDAIDRVPYSDPDGALNLGVVKIEAGDPPRTSWGVLDDVDDFDGWSASPPEASDGTALPGLSARWTRSVEVVLVARDALSELGVLSGGQGVKRVVVTVKRDGVVLGRAVGLRTLGADLARDGEAPASPSGGGLLGGLGGLFGG